VKAFVVDASVAAKWCLPGSQEPLCAEAEDLLHRYAIGQIELLAPDLFWAELGNLLWKAARAGRISPETAEICLAKVQQLGLASLSSADLVSQALQVAMASERTVYDSLYVAAALAAKAELVTADERLANAMGTRFPVRWLGSLANSW